MDQVKVQIRKAQPVQRFLKGCLRVFIAHLLDVGLRRDEEFRPRDAAAPDGPAHRFLVLIGAGGIQQPVARGDRLAHHLFAVRFRDLEDAETL